MKTHPIVFSQEMIRAILDGRKTQTRRVIKDVPGYVDYFAQRGGDQRNGGPWDVWRGYMIPGEPTAYTMKSRYGGPGDRLWVRETFWKWERHGVYNSEDDLSPWFDYDYVCYVQNPRIGRRKNQNTGEVDNITFLDESTNLDYHGCVDVDKTPKSPSIFMPRWASRIALEVVDVRVERVQEISHEDALAEGIDPNADYNNYGTGSIYRDTFAELWDRINERRGFSWKRNPWVWVVGFRVRS